MSYATLAPIETDSREFFHLLAPERRGGVFASVGRMDNEDLTGRIIGCAIEVHRTLGPGLLERTYEAAMMIELHHQRLKCTRQVGIPISYRDEWIGEYRIDMIVEDLVILEIKSTERDDRLYEAQALAYLRASGLHVALVINFNSKLLSHGLKRLVI
jgi:GxxExxY protein